MNFPEFVTTQYEIVGRLMVANHAKGTPESNLLVNLIANLRIYEQACAEDGVDPRKDQALLEAIGLNAKMEFDILTLVHKALGDPPSSISRFEFLRSIVEEAYKLGFTTARKESDETRA